MASRRMWLIRKVYFFFTLAVLPAMVDVLVIKSLVVMGILLFTKAPLAVQLNRVVFSIYAVLFGWPIWCFRHTIVLSGWAIFSSFVFCSLLGLGYTFIRLRRSRWILAFLGLIIPAAFWTSMCLMEFSRPVWWEWPFDVLVLVLWFGYPVLMAVSLFRDKKTSEYFTSAVS